MHACRSFGNMNEFMDGSVAGCSLGVAAAERRNCRISLANIMEGFLLTLEVKCPDLFTRGEA